MKMTFDEETQTYGYQTGTQTTVTEMSYGNPAHDWRAKL